ncbi:MAG: DedA family protein [Marinilabiliaceae bacterium]|nr:DedA family protein [Bacteroidales bacterium]MDD5816716.1 DedA family protein [Bacteroidales bacterium]MDY4519963.1 DedA family protein [Bacteroidales bacterium]
MDELIAWCLDHLNYWVITLLMTIESSFIPFPSEVVVPPAAYRAAASADLNVYLVVLFATIGADLGAIINYVISRTLGRMVIYKFAESKLGHICLIDSEKVQTAEAFFVRHGAASTFFGRLVPAVRQLISIPAGLAKMNFGKFLLFTTLGAGIWNSILAFAGYTLQSVMPEEEMLATVSRYNDELKVACVVIVAIVVLFFVVRHFVKKRQNRISVE